MRKLILAAALAAMPLAGCATTGVPLQHVPAATVAAADAAYVAFEKGTELAVRAGKMNLATFHQRNDQAYSVLLKVRAGQSTLEALQAVIGH
jgi:hypothetical protein